MSPKGGHDGAPRMAIVWPVQGSAFITTSFLDETSN